MEEELKGFTIRVYMLIEHNGKLLVSDEIIQGKPYVKLPGGGLEWGEGLRDAALREAREELGEEVELTGHHYTTDFFIESRFLPSQQVIAVYFTARLTADSHAEVFASLSGEARLASGQESFRWVSPSPQLVQELSFASDKYALTKWLTERNFT